MRLAATEPAPVASAPPRRPRPRPPRLLGSRRFDDVVALARAKRDIQLVQSLERDVRLARFEQGSIAFTLVEGAESGTGADAKPTTAGMDGRALDGGACPGLDRADVARDGAGA